MLEVRIGQGRCVYAPFSILTFDTGNRPTLLVDFFCLPPCCPTERSVLQVAQRTTYGNTGNHQPQATSAIDQEKICSISFLTPLPSSSA
jgi:hypothetical protein